MKNRITNLLSSLLLVAALGLALAPWIGTSTTAVKQAEDFCHTADEDATGRGGYPTNCFGEIVVTP